jgi:hypothetical protein
VEQALKGWAAKFNLNACWVLDAARDTLSAWAANPGYPREGFVVTGNKFELPADWSVVMKEHEQFEFVFRHPGWNPFFETWEGALHDQKDPEGRVSPGICDEFKRELEDYKKRVEAWAARLRCELPARNIKQEHLEWTALVHAKRRNVQSVIHRYAEGRLGTSRNVGTTVRKAIRRVESPYLRFPVAVQAGCARNPAECFFRERTQGPSRGPT